MLRPDLTLADGLREVGTPLRHVQRRFAHGDTFVNLDRELHEATSAKNEQALDALHLRWLAAWNKKGLGRMIGEDERFQELFQEMLGNALQHGTDWCRTGSVSVDAYIAETRGKALWTITQTGKGFDVKGISAALEVERTDTTRGNGLRLAADCPDWEVWFERFRKRRDQFRTLLLRAGTAADRPPQVAAV
jgi:hypothetical protein